MSIEYTEVQSGRQLPRVPRRQNRKSQEFHLRREEMLRGKTPRKKEKINVTRVDKVPRVPAAVQADEDASQPANSPDHGGVPDHGCVLDAPHPVEEPEIAPGVTCSHVVQKAHAGLPTKPVLTTEPNLTRRHSPAPEVFPRAVQEVILPPDLLEPEEPEEYVDDFHSEAPNEELGTSRDLLGG